MHTIQLYSCNYFHMSKRTHIPRRPCWSGNTMQEPCCVEYLTTKSAGGFAQEYDRLEKAGETRRKKSSFVFDKNPFGVRPCLFFKPTITASQWRPTLYEKLSVDVMSISFNSMLTVHEINQCKDILCDTTFVQVWWYVVPELNNFAEIGPMW